MQKIVSPLIILFFASLSFHAMADTDKPAMYGVLFYADWCGSCQVLDPKLEKARGKAGLDEKDILFVRLDLTSEASSKQAALMASALNMGELYKANGGKTGFMSLVDVKTGQSVGKLTKNMSVDQIVAKIQGNI